MSDQTDDIDIDDAGDIAPTTTDDQDIYISTLEELISSTENCDYGGGAWLDLYGMVDGHPVKINLTSHARTPESALRNLMKTVTEAIHEYKLKPYNPTSATPASAPASSRAAAPTAPTTSSAPVVPPVSVAGAAPPAPGVNASAGGVIVTERVEVVPRADGKTEVKFWAANRKFADLIVVRLPTALAEQFSAATGASWTAAHFEHANSYAIALRVTWVPSTRLNNSGQPYKNVEKIEAV